MLLWLYVDGGSQGPYWNSYNVGYLAVKLPNQWLKRDTCWEVFPEWLWLPNCRWNAFIIKEIKLINDCTCYVSVLELFLGQK